MEKIIQKFESKKNEYSDIHEHLETLRRYALECDRICEMGVRAIVSTWAFLASNPKKMISIDYYNPENFGSSIKEVELICDEYNISFKFILANTLEVEIDECDLLFIDTWHDYKQLKMELHRHHTKVTKYIILHDTNSFAFKNEPFYETYDSEREITNLPQGLIPAIDEFLCKNPQWYVYERFSNNNGLTILKKI